MPVRTPAPALVAAVRAVLEERAGTPITGADLLKAARERGVEADSLRRIQEALQHLLVVERVPVASTSSRPAGYRLGSADDLRASVRELDARIVGTFSRRRALRVALAAAEGALSPQLRLFEGGRP